MLPKVTNKLIIYTDGASKGNPGPAGAGAAFIVDGKVQGKLSWFIPRATNNQAEYTAVLLALQLVRQMDIDYIEVRADSLLVVNQLNHFWQIKDESLKIFFTQIMRMVHTMQSVGFVHIPREQNKEADALANKAIEDYERT